MSAGNSYTGEVVALRPFGKYLCFTLKIHGFQHRPGDYAVLDLHDRQGSFQAYYSIASPPRQSELVDFCVIYAQNPRFEEFYNHLAVGDVITCAEPAGLKFSGHKLEGSGVFIAGGSGIAPLRAMLLNYLAQPEPRPLHLIYGCYDGVQMPYADELYSLGQQNPQLKVALYAPQGHGGFIESGDIMTGLDSLDDWSQTFYSCGPKAMIEAVQAYLQQRGVPQERFIYEGH